MQLPFNPKHLLFVFCVFLFSCATKYYPVNPTQITYGNKAEKSDVDFYYRYDVMAAAKNGRQTLKEMRNDIKIVAVKIYNSSNQQITIGENVKFYEGDKELQVVPTEILKRRMKQGVIPYLGYLALSPVKFSYEKDGGAKTVQIFGGAIIGGTLAAANIWNASKANAKLKKNLDTYSIIGKNVLPGETVYGLVALQRVGYIPLQLKMVK
ncbi:MAG: hypothetical protein HYR66_09685 [Sphingobacteriales bacterium]|nr:hypothetical protein [Sphingobacteriales bacterium]MBI3719059.1 hypothetical protein [Sphingobacteriales bacterium]